MWVKKHQLDCQHLSLQPESPQSGLTSLPTYLSRYSIMDFSLDRQVVD